MGMGSNPAHVCFRGHGFKSHYGPVSTDNASLYLKARYLYLRTPKPAIVLGGGTRTYVQKMLLLLGSPATWPVSTRVLA